MFKTLRGPAVCLAAISLMAIALAGCGESSEEKATAQVCSSTKEIQAQLSKLATLSISSTAPEEIKDAAGVMQKEAEKIKDSAPNLPASSKSDVEAAQNGLKSALLTAAAAVASSVVSSSSAEDALKQAEPKLKTAVTGLATSYKQAFESLKCS